LLELFLLLVAVLVDFLLSLGASVLYALGAVYGREWSDGWVVATGYGWANYTL
jgi:hypothetical protein